MALPVLVRVSECDSSGVADSGRRLRADDGFGTFGTFGMGLLDADLGLLARGRRGALRFALDFAVSGVDAAFFGEVLRFALGFAVGGVDAAFFGEGDRGAVLALEGFADGRRGSRFGPSPGMANLRRAVRA